MIVFIGIFSSIFYTCLLGLIWPTNSKLPMAAQLLGAIGKSLWISWFLVVFMYAFQVIIPFWLIVGGWVALIVVQNNETRVLLYLSQKNSYILAGIMLIMTLFIIWIFKTDQYIPIFNKGDAIASWNKWAIELSKNTYEPWNTAYPVLFPGVWSLIYKAQEDETIWYFAKFSLIILPIILCFLIWILVYSKRFLAALLGSFFIGYFFLYTYAEPMMAGYMDIPVMIMMMATTILLIVSFDGAERGISDGELFNILMISAIFAGLSAITKQAGSLVIIVFLISILLLVRQKKIGWQRFSFLAILCLSPLLTYLIMFWDVQPDLTGNLPILIDLTEKVRKMIAPNGTVYESAYRLIARNVGITTLFIFILIAAFNLKNYKKLSGQLGILFLITAFIGFFMYVNCCAYNERNGWWIYAFLVPSMLLALPSFGLLSSFPLFKGSNRIFLIPFPILTFAGTVLIMSILGGLMMPNKKIKSAHKQDQWSLLLTKDMRPLLKKLHGSIPTLSKDWIIISPHQQLRWLPKFKPHYRLCLYYQPDCVRREMKASTTTFLFVNTKNKYHQFVDLAPFLPESKLIGKQGYMRLYGPLTLSDLKFNKN